MFDLLNGQKSDKIKGANDFHFEGQQLTWKKPKKAPKGRSKFLKFMYADNFIQKMEIPEKGDYIFCIVSGSFIFGDIMLPLAEKTGIAKLHISTLSIGEENIDMILEMFEIGLISECNLILSDYFYSHERKQGGLWHYLFERLSPFNIKVSIANVHTKIVMLESDTHSLVMSGSANLRSSANVEQITIHNDDGLLAWNLDWQEEIHKKYDCVKKPIRNRNTANIFGV